MQNYFPPPSYETADFSVWRWLRAITRPMPLLFHAQFFFILCRGWRLAKQGNYSQEEANETARRTVRLVERTGGRITITGLNYVADSSEPAVIIGNHMGNMETAVLFGLLLPLRHVVFIVKKSLTDHWFFGPITTARDCVPIARVNPREDFETVMREGQKWLADGSSIIIFPQSTRSTEFNAAEFNTIGVKLAKKANVPVIPLALKTDFWGMHPKWKDIGPVQPEKPVHFAFGEPFEVKNGRQAHKRVIAFIEGNLRDWGHMP